MGSPVRWLAVLVYLDQAAGAPLHPAAAAAMTPWVTTRFGNPSGVHQVARAARLAIDEVRDDLAAWIGVEPGGVTFTSGGTEADNLAVLGVVSARPGPVVVSAVEHPAVLEAAAACGHEVRLAPVGSDGVVDPDALERLLDPDVTLVSVQTANHETGVIQPVAAIARRVRRRAKRAVLHTDAIAAAPWLDLAEATGEADLVTVSAHKFGGPAGAGVLAARNHPPLVAILHGGGQERELRSGSHNVAAIVGMGAAARATTAGRDAAVTRVAAQRDHLASRLLASVPGCTLTAPGSPRLPGHLHLRLAGIESEALLVLLDDAGVCASAGAACASGAMEPSPVLLAMGVPKDEALGSLRLTLGPSTSDADIDLAAAAIPAEVARLRGPG
jgi:cysteine desulfurase